jgi:hypothetical protein
MTETSIDWTSVVALGMLLAFFAFVVWCGTRGENQDSDVHRIMDGFRKPTYKQKRKRER